MSVRQQLAELPCPGDGAIPAEGEKNLCVVNQCAACQGTGLRFPTLSREVKHGYDLETDSGWVPDVTTDKLLRLLVQNAGYVACEYDPKYGYIFYDYKHLSFAPGSWSQSLEDALAAALLASVQS